MRTTARSAVRSRPRCVMSGSASRQVVRGDDLPAPSPWLSRLLAFDPRRVLFAHDRSVWEP